jgi:hypothetical protein
VKSKEWSPEAELKGRCGVALSGLVSALSRSALASFNSSLALPSLVSSLPSLVSALSSLVSALSSLISSLVSALPGLEVNWRQILSREPNYCRYAYRHQPDDTHNTRTGTHINYT